MLDLIIYERKLRRLRRTKRRIGSAYDRDIADAYREKRPSEEIERIRYNRHWEIGNCDEEISELQTNHFIALADKYGVAPPPCAIRGGIPSDGWYESKMFGRLLLTTGGRAKLRSDIRLERKERRDGWLPYISALTGLLGVTVAIIALVVKH